MKEIRPYPKNAKKHPKKQIELIANSIERFGWQQPIVVDKDGEIIVGHGRYLAYKSRESLPEPWVTDNLGNTLSGKQGKELTPKEVKAYRLADNKINESDWDIDLVIEELLNLDDLIPLTGFDLDELQEKNIYTTKIESPIYEPTGEQPKLEELIDESKTKELQKEIEEADIPEEVKYFLVKAANRHTVFDYSKIANYYAHAPKEVQELIEDSALVIIDFNKAIEKGFATLTKKIEEQYLDEYGE